MNQITGRHSTDYDGGLGFGVVVFMFLFFPACIPMLSYCGPDLDPKTMETIMGIDAVAP